MRFSRQAYWSGLPFPPPRDLPNPGMEDASPGCLEWSSRFFPTEPHGKAQSCIYVNPNLSICPTLTAIARTWNSLNVQRQMNEWECIPEYYAAIKRNETGSFVEMWMDLESVTQSEVSQKDNNKYHTVMQICEIYRWNRWTCFQGRNRHVDIEKGQKTVLRISKISGKQHKVLF